MSWQPQRRPAPARPVIPYRSSSARTGAAPPDAYFPDKIKDFQLPLVLLVAGLLVESGAYWWSAAGGTGNLLRAMTQVGVDVLVGTSLMLVAVFLAAKTRGIDLGRFWTAVLKLSAVSVAPSAVMTLLHVLLWFVPFGGLIVLVLGFCFYFALIGAFFDLDQSDTWYCVCVIFLVKVAVALGAWWLLGK